MLSTKGPNNKRSRGHRGNGRRAGFHGRGSTFESSGPEGKIRGTAFQVIEKYQALARDALSAGDRIGAENFFQHAEHYHRVVTANGWDQRSRPQGQQNHAPQHGERKPEDGRGPGADIASAGPVNDAPASREEPPSQPL